MVTIPCQQNALSHKEIVGNLLQVNLEYEDCAWEVLQITKQIFGWRLLS